MESSTLSISIDGKSLQLPASKSADAMKASDEKERVGKKRKGSGKKASEQASKRSRSENKALQSTVPVSAAVPSNASNHARIQADVGKRVKKTSKKSQQKGKRKAAASTTGAGKKKKAKPTNSRKRKGTGDLKAPLDAPADNVFGDESGQGFDGPRESYQGCNLSELGGAEAEIVDEKVAHYRYGSLQEQAEAEIAEEHVPVAPEVGPSSLINWEHFSLVYEEYCLTKEVNKGV